MKARKQRLRIVSLQFCGCRVWDMGFPSNPKPQTPHPAGFELALHRPAAELLEGILKMPCKRAACLGFRDYVGMDKFLGMM